MNASVNAPQNRDFPIGNYGACICDRLQTKQIQSAIDDCFLQGGGRVIIPAGIYLTGGLRLRSGVTLYLQAGAILRGSPNPEDYNDYIHDPLEPIETIDDPTVSRSVYPFSRWNNAVIRVIEAHDIAIIGETGSYIDGGDCFDAQGEEGYRGPHGINIQRSHGILLEGYTVLNCGNWAHAIFCSQDITVRCLRVFGGHDSFDIRTCDRVLIEECEFRSGDDCVAGFDNHDCVIRNCLLDTACSAFRFGGNNILIENCRAVAPASFGFRGSLSKEEKAASAPTAQHHRHNMLTFFLYYCDFRAVIRKDPGNITIRNCEIENADRLFNLQFDGKHRWCINRSLHSIHFENCHATGIRLPIHIHSSREEPLDFSLDHVDLTAAQGCEEVPFLKSLHHRAITLKNVTLRDYTDPTAICCSDGTFYAENSTPLTVLRADPSEMGL